MLKCIEVVFLVSPCNLIPQNLFQVILPALLEQSHTRAWLKSLIRVWCQAVSYVLDIKSYLLGETPPPTAAPLVEERQVDLGAAHHALFQRGGPTGFQPYERPRYEPFNKV